MSRLFLLIVFTISCGTASITLSPTPPADLTVPQRLEKHFATMMVLPPRGSDRGQVSELSDVERVLLAGGVRVISSGVTGRVVLDQAGNRVETAANLSDLERALVLARSSNAEALLQIIDIGWIEGRRAFVRSGDRFSEVTPGTSVEGSNLVRIREAVFKFQARVIDVENGEILLSIDVSQSTSRALPAATIITIETSPIATSVRDVETDAPDRRRTVVSQVMDAFLVRLTQNRHR